VRISRSGAEIESKELMPLWANLRINLPGDPREDAVYAKVVKHIDDQEARFQARFTSFSETLLRLIESSGH
jgi:hypothetical protein